MVYTQGQVYKQQIYYPNEQLVVDGSPDNVCQREKGINYLGRRVAEYIISNLYDKCTMKLSFIIHSFGGLVQTFAIAYIAVKSSWFFENVEPIHFITMASPSLGIVTDNPAYIKMLLSFGVIGKTGQDLGLDKSSKDDNALLYLLSGKPIRTILSRLKRRTLYANVVNEGNVPLYTVSLLFLDYNCILDFLNKNSANRTITNDDITISDNTRSSQKFFINPLSTMKDVWGPQKFSNNKKHSSSKLPKIPI